MNTNNEVIYTVIGGLLIKNVPHFAEKIKILSNGSIIAVEKSGNESFIYGPYPSINHDYDKYSFVVFDVPPLAPKLTLVGHHQLTVKENCGGPIESGKTYVVGDQGLPAEALQFYGRGNRVKPANAETPDKNKGVNLLTITFESGSKLSDVINIVESEIQNSGCNVTDNISSISVNELKKDISSIIKDKIYAVSQSIATHVYEEEYNSSQVTLLMNKLNNLESLMRKITHGGDMRLNVIS